MRTRTVLASLVSTGAAAALVTAAPPATAAPSVPLVNPHVLGTAAASTVGPGGVVGSGPTAVSGLSTTNGGVARSNSIAGTANALFASDAAATRIASTSVPGGLSVLSHARTTGLNLLNGLISARTVDTTSTATIVDGQTTTDVNTVFAGLSVRGLPVPVSPDRNTTISIPGVASVTLNAESVTTGRAGTTATGAAVIVTLLSGVGNSVPGTEIRINPVRSFANMVGRGYSPLRGIAYGTRVTGAVNGLGGLTVNRTAATVMRSPGTRGKDISNSTLGVDLPGLGTVGAISTVANGVVTRSGSRSTLRTTVSGVNLLGGLITADTLTGTAEANQDADGTRTSSGSSQLVGLTIAGQSIPSDVAPNTVMNLPGGAGVVTINGVSLTRGRAVVRVLRVRLTAASYGLPAGAVIEVGVATADFAP